MRITFMGLIAHVTLDQGLSDERQLAVLVAASKHFAYLSTPKASIIDDGGLEYDRDGNHYCFPLTGRVTWLEFDGGKAAHLDKSGVPSLLNITNGKIHELSPELKAEMPSTLAFHAVVDLPKSGWLAPVGFFQKEVDFNSTAHGPMPHTMLYLVATEHEKFMRIRIGTSMIVLNSDADIVISNTCPEESDGLHFQNYRKLFHPPATIVLNPVESDRLCPFGTPAGPLPCVRRTLQVDCGNGGIP